MTHPARRATASPSFSLSANTPCLERVDNSSFTLEMEKERSRPGNGGKRGRAGGDGGVSPSATEDEVEEFFAILRRIRAASRQICGGRQMTVTEKGARWKPTFEWEDFEGPNGVKTNGEVLEAVREVDTEKKKKKKEEDLQGGLELDLNEEPKPEKPEHFS